MNARQTTEKYLKIENTRFKLRYVDYEPGAWTMPVLLTKDRAERFLEDNSVTEVIFIAPNGTTEDLIMR
jgi:hypothetical protein